MFFSLTTVLHCTCPLGHSHACKHRHSKSAEEDVPESSVLRSPDKLLASLFCMLTFLDFVVVFPLPQKMKSILPTLYLCLTNSNSTCLVVTCIIQFLNLAWNCYPERLESGDVNMGKQEFLLKRANIMFWKRSVGRASQGWSLDPGHCWTGQMTAQSSLISTPLLLFGFKVTFSFFFIRDW